MFPLNSCGSFSSFHRKLCSIFSSFTGLWISLLIQADCWDELNSVSCSWRGWKVFYLSGAFLWNLLIATSCTGCLSHHKSSNSFKKTKVSQQCFMYIVVYSFVDTPPRVKLWFDSLEKKKKGLSIDHTLPTWMMCTMIYKSGTLVLSVQLKSPRPAPEHELWRYVYEKNVSLMPQSCRSEILFYFLMKKRILNM